MLFPEKQTLSVYISPLYFYLYISNFLFFVVVLHGKLPKLPLVFLFVTFASLSSFVIEETVNKKGSENIFTMAKLGG